MASGWLHLESVKGREKWDLRYFVLDEGYLRYFVDEDDLDPVAVINVKGVEATSVGKARVGKHAFRLNVTRQEDGRYKYVLAGESEEEALRWLKALIEQGVAASLSSIRLTARPDRSADLGTRFLSFGKGGPKPSAGKKAPSTLDGMVAFLSFKKGPTQKKKPPTLAAAPAAEAPAAAEEADDAPPASPPPLDSAQSSAFGRLRRESTLSRLRQASDGCLLQPRSSIEALAAAGDIDGDQPFSEVMASLSRPSFVERSASMSLVRASQAERADSTAAPLDAATPIAEEESDSGEEPDEDAELVVDEGDDEEEAAAVAAEGADTVGGVTPVLLTAGSGVAEEGGGAAARPSEVPSFASFVGDSFVPPTPTSAARPPLTSGGSSMAYGSNYEGGAEAAQAGAEAGSGAGAEAGSGAAVATADVNVSVPSAVPSAEAAAEPNAAAAATTAEAEAMAVAESLVESAIQTATADAADAADALGQSVAAAAVSGGLAEAATEAAPEAAAEAAPASPRASMERKPSLLERASSMLGLGPKSESTKSAAAADEPPPPPPKPAVVDSPEEAVVRAWIRQTLLAADDTKSLSLLADHTTSLRDHLRSGVVLCATLNALKPRAVGRVRAAAASASRFAKLEALNTYKRACGTAGLTERDCLEPGEWLDGATMAPLFDHLAALSRLFPTAPKFKPPGGLRKAPTKAGTRGGGSITGAVPHATFRDTHGGKVRGSVTRSVAAEGTSAWRGAASNASAARAVFEIEKKGGLGLKPSDKPAAGGTGAAVTVKSDTGATHSFAESETIAFSEFINETLAGDEAVSHLLPLDPSTMDLFDVLKDGVILCKLINAAQEETIDMRVVHTGQLKPLSVYEVVENLNMAINAAVAIGCRIVNIGPDDVMNGSPHLCLGLLWQIVKAAIMANINLKASPELMALLGADGDDLEAVKALNALAPEKVLLKWLNYQVQRVAPGAKDVTNFGAALKDCTVYANLLTAVAPAEHAATVAHLSKMAALEKDPIARAAMIIDAAQTLGVTQFKVLPADISKGNEKLNMGFTAAIFNHLPGLNSSADEGNFNPALACGSAFVKEGGRAVLLTETGAALFGRAMEADTGTHFVELRVLEATDPQSYIGVMHAQSDKESLPGFATAPVASCSLGGGGGVLREGGEIGATGVTFGKGDLIRAEYDSASGTLKWFKDGQELSYLAQSVAPGMHFAVGRGAGEFEVRIENSSFMSEAQRGAAKLLESLGGEDESDSREERSFKMWINSLGLDQHVSDLAAEVRDGLLILKLMDKIKPGVVDWSKTAPKPKNIHAKVINCNYAVALGKSAFGFSLVGIQGKDIQDGITKLVLALTWQLMRYHIINFLSSMSSKQLTEKDVVEWANTKVASMAPAAANAQLGAVAPIQRLSDSSLSSGIYVLSLLKAVAPRSVDLAQVTPGVKPDDKKLNAKLAVSCARKAGCLVFLLWEDIVEYRPKMLLVLFATLMQLDLARAAEAAEASK